MSNQVIAIGLDGCEISIASEMVAQGKLPTFKRLLEQTAVFDLQHGDARYTGLAWEHFSVGKKPVDYQRWSAVGFDKSTYRTIQFPAANAPFTSGMDCRVVAFDVPYFRMPLSPQATGMVNWGAHDPGVPTHCNPAGLSNEIHERFGDYPASEYIYGFVWPSAENTQRMGDRLSEAVRTRSQIAQWLLKERLPVWDLALIVTSEMHSGLEALWHGWDATHPLNGHPSTVAAKRGIESIYEETDSMLAGLLESFPEADFVVFSMHGMGPNQADVPSMTLLPEWMYRRHFGKPFLRIPKTWFSSKGEEYPSNDDWSRTVRRRMSEYGRLRSKLQKWLGKPTRQESTADEAAGEVDLGWMPSTAYMPFWKSMPAFALPSFYDAQVRINLVGRESQGVVSGNEYGRYLDQLQAEIEQITCAYSGETLVTNVQRPVEHDPLVADATQCDLKFRWKKNAVAIRDPNLGVIGPVPHRRTGGHTGGHGFACCLSNAIPAGHHGERSSFDITPTLIDLAGDPALAEQFSGKSLIDLRRARVPVSTE